MSIPRHYTIGAVAPDLGSLKALDERLENEGLSPESLTVLLRRRDERLVGVTLPGVRTLRVEMGLSRLQWFEFTSTFFSASTVSFLMGVVHLWTGILVQVALTIAAVVGLVLYYRHPRLRKMLLSMALPEKFAEQWAQDFSGGFALALVIIHEDRFDAAQDALLNDPTLASPMAVDRRPVF
ncbi:MAG: hypothetical protein H0W54_02515 [Rubrobacter sp.]|nr:hypothetical protein [Rubrobacter sp.]